MNSAERQVVFFIADISEYTQFIFSNEKEIAHSQIIIQDLITTLLDEVEFPLQLIRIEGDAIFLYADKDDPEQPWESVSKDLVSNMIAMFQVFADKLSELTIHKICNCSACNNIEKMNLKAVVHSGPAAFYRVNEHQELTGTGPIIVHRLLKNSIESDAYILFTESAYNDLPLPEGGDVEEGEETYHDIGTIKTYVYYPPEPQPFVHDPNDKPPSIFIDTLHKEISQEYARVAQTPELGFHFHTGRHLANLLEYRGDWLEGLPESAIESFAGTGNPFNLRPLRPGSRVVDAGSGAGLDSLIAANLVGDAGQVIGVDMTKEMVEKASSNAQEVGAKNVSFEQGYIEELPVGDGWADVVISNGAINLAPDKDGVFRELNRVLRPGGWLQIADILVEKPVPDSAKQNIDLWAG
jgi:2-polyprenyl-3-methyl-5-hydroxy-6-metoxy-1,4-benzoquinol methylase